MKNIMITGPESNSGKTTLTLGLIRAMKNRGLDVSAWKTGPDFVDTKYLGLASRKRAGNLDMHLMGRKDIRRSLEMNKGQLGVIEGAMGYFDGIYNSFENSSYDISRELNIPAILVYTPKGEMFSAIPKIKGMVDFPSSMIKGIILNKTDLSYYGLLKEQIEKYIGIKVLGYLPYKEDLNIGSGSLGLENPKDQETSNIFLDRLAQAVEETVDLDGILKIMASMDIKEYKYPKARNIKIAIAYDQAFNLYFNENLKLLEKTCHVEYFSPIKDKELPECDLVYIGGGYPELYLEELSKNKEILRSIRQAGEDGKYILAESAGFMYLTRSIENYPMVGIFKGQARMTDSLKRFGYVNIEFKEDNILGEKSRIIPGNEYHKSLVEIEDSPIFNIGKPKSKRSWQCGYSYKNTLAYYQHFNFIGNMDLFNELLDRIEYKGKR